MKIKDFKTYIERKKSTKSKIRYKMHFAQFLIKVLYYKYISEQTQKYYSTI